MSNNNGLERLQEARDEAADVLLHLMRNAQSEEVRLEAAQTVLRNGEIASRLALNEQLVKEINEGSVAKTGVA
jgi:hypothetical protein